MEKTVRKFSVMSKTRLLLIGPVPPPIGGTSVLFQHLQRELDQRGEFDVKTINTANLWGRAYVLPFTLAWQLLLLLRWLPWANVVSFHASTQRFVVFGGVLTQVCRLFRRPLVARVFGGSLCEVGARLSGWRLACYRSIMQADVVLVEMKQMLQELSEHFPESRFEWFANSRPLPSIKDAVLPSSRKNHKHLIFSLISHVRAEKGIYEIGEAVKLLGERDDFEVRLYGRLFGDVDLSRVEVSERVKYYGELKPEQVAEALKASDVVLLPSWYDGEGYPGTIIEAFTYGRPSIATNWKYIPEIASNEVNALLVAPKDVAALSEAMQGMLDDRDLLKRLADGARQSAQDFSSSHWNGDKFRDYCLSVLK
jgi:glycosyltransferase involved in cell wall biosynthesis